MQHLLRHFVGEGPGRWTCVEGVDVHTPAGRMQVTAGTRFVRGTKFMNFDVAAALDQEYSEAQPSQRANGAG